MRNENKIPTLCFFQGVLTFKCSDVSRPVAKFFDGRGRSNEETDLTSAGGMPQLENFEN